jgi:hypothetical protein
MSTKNSVSKKSDDLLRELEVCLAAQGARLERLEKLQKERLDREARIEKDLAESDRLDREFHDPAASMNRWTQELGQNTCDARALLVLMRPVVEEILVARGHATNPRIIRADSEEFDTSLVVSQSMRSNRCLEEWNNMAPHGLEELQKHGKDMRLLKDFLAVHRTVWILDSKPL